MKNTLMELIPYRLVSKSELAAAEKERNAVVSAGMQSVLTFVNKQAESSNEEIEAIRKRNKRLITWLLIYSMLLALIYYLIISKQLVWNNSNL